MSFPSIAATGPTRAAGFLDDQAAALQVARRAYGQAEATQAQIWVSLKYAVNADRRCLEILGA